MCLITEIRSCVLACMSRIYWRTARENSRLAEVIFFSRQEYGTLYGTGANERCADRSSVVKWHKQKTGSMNGTPGG